MKEKKNKKWLLNSVFLKKLANSQKFFCLSPEATGV
jgi:hypothetical protein